MEKGDHPLLGRRRQVLHQPLGHGGIGGPPAGH